MNIYDRRPHDKTRPASPQNPFQSRVIEVLTDDVKQCEITSLLLLIMGDGQMFAFFFYPIRPSFNECLLDGRLRYRSVAVFQVENVMPVTDSSVVRRQAN